VKDSQVCHESLGGRSKRRERKLRNKKHPQNARSTLSFKITIIRILAIKLEHCLIARFLMIKSLLKSWVP
jgi:hypothetical protein